MAAVVSVPANEGISVKNEKNDPEIDAMALKIKESMQKNAAAASARPLPTGVYINRAGRPVVTLPKDTQLAVPLAANQVTKTDCKEDATTYKGLFGWKQVGTQCAVPYVIRTIDGEQQKFVSVRIAEAQLLSKYLNFLHADIYTCAAVRSHFITEMEAKLFNEINSKHSDYVYGKEPFMAGKEYVVRLEDAEEFYAFIEVCYKKLLCNIAPGRNEKCGFIRINSESVVPYCIKDGQKYVPLFYFEGETDNLRLRAEKLENWNLAYLKFCCKVQGIRNELFASDSCVVTSLEDIKNYFPPDTNFEEYWPAKVVDAQLLNNNGTNSKSSMQQTNAPPGAWVRAPPPLPNKAMSAVPVANHDPVVVMQQQKQHVMTAPSVLPVASVAPQHQQSMSMANNTAVAYQNGGWPPNQMVNSYNAQAQMSSTRGYSTTSRNQSGVTQYYNPGTIIQTNGQVNHATPPPLIRANNNNMNPVVGNTVSYANNSMGQPMATVYPMMTNNTLTNSQMRQFYNNQRAGGQNQQMLTQYGQTIQTSGANARIVNTQPRNALRNVTSAATAPVSEVIDLSSPPSSPIPQSATTDTRRFDGIELKRIPERPWRHETSNNAAYKILKATLHGKIVHCINAKPYVYSDLMVTLEDLVLTLFPLCPVNRCAQILYSTLKLTLYTGNSEQISVLRDNGRLKSTYAEEVPMAMLQEVSVVLLQLKSLISKYDEQRSQDYHQAKRQRMS